ncbi:hypothetical protein EDB86DRAFT_3096628 [Lactarius hatsudake]|nr:hypothetical protein EDB86DRAFT_3096628 [Lactarius hatsudake]
MPVPQRHFCCSHNTTAASSMLLPPPPLLSPAPISAPAPASTSAPAPAPTSAPAPALVPPAASSSSSAVAPVSAPFVPSPILTPQLAGAHKPIQKIPPPVILPPLPLPLILPVACHPFDHTWNVHSLGDLTIQCPNCKALHWLAEHLTKSSMLNPKFGMCCFSGKIALPPLQSPPLELSQAISKPWATPEIPVVMVETVDVIDITVIW